MPRSLLGSLALILLALGACERPLPATHGVPPRAVAQVEGWLAGVDVPVPQPGPAPRRDARLLALGAEVYRLRCTPCHGVSGNGRGPHASRLHLPPRDFTAGVYELRSTPSGALPTDEDLYRTVSRGLRGTAMLPFGWLTELERRAVVEHVKSFSGRFADEEAGDPIVVPPAPVESPELAELGRTTYASVGCPNCHGALGNGDGPAVPTLRRDSGYPIRPRPFSEGCFLRGSSLPELWLTLATGLDGTPMPSYQTLSPEDLWALAEHVRLRARTPRPASLSDAEQRRGFEIDILGR